MNKFIQNKDEIEDIIPMDLHHVELEKRIERLEESIRELNTMIVLIFEVRKEVKYIYICLLILLSISIGFIIAI